LLADKVSDGKFFLFYTSEDSVVFNMWFILLLPTVGCGTNRLAMFDQSNIAVPRLEFVTPTAAGATADASFDFSVRFADVDGNETWGIYYLSDAAEDRGAAIGLGLSVKTSGTLNVSWVTAELPSGTYNLHAELNSAEGTTTAVAPGAVTIDHAGFGNANPTVQVVSPNGGETLPIGKPVVVTWDASDPDGDSLTYNVELSRDAGTSWTVLASKLIDKSWTWQVNLSDPEGNSYRIRVRASDGANGAASDVSESDFSLYLPITWENTIKDMMIASCGGAACHSSGGDWVDRFASDDYTNEANTGVSQLFNRVLARAINTESMPPAGGDYLVLNASQKARFLAWVQSGTPKD
jgi:hypothetical protein